MSLALKSQSELLSSLQQQISFEWTQCLATIFVKIARMQLHLNLWKMLPRTIPEYQQTLSYFWIQGKLLFFGNLQIHGNRYTTTRTMGKVGIRRRENPCGPLTRYTEKSMPQGTHRQTPLPRKQLFRKPSQVPFCDSTEMFIYAYRPMIIEHVKRVIIPENPQISPSK